jgi:hypothetical protein
VGEIINLKRVKKAKTRAEAERRAAENRTRHGLTKAAKEAQRREQERQRKLQAGHKLDEGEDKT